ncbi:MAG TPA: YafY family protein [Cytophagales bacterium]|nr:YafY family protein [Cytophagales bacterium]
MNRLQRLTAILIHLQSKRIIRASEIANKYDISLRTVYRDIRSLEEAGVPIGVEAGKGYFIISGYNLPPVMFTNAEAAALLMGAKLMNKWADSSLQKEFANALIKIKAVLRENDKDKMEELDKSVHIARSSHSSFSDFPNHWLSDLQLSIINKNELRISYFSIYNNQNTVRDICPIGLCHYSSAWHLIAFCKLRNDYRDFRVDRIRELRIMDKKFSSGAFSSLQEYLDTLSKNENLIEVVVRFDKDVRKYIQNQKFYYGFVDEIETDGFVEMTFLCPSMDYIGRWLLLFNCSVQIVKPLELKETLVSLAQAALENFSKELAPVEV